MLVDGVHHELVSVGLGQNLGPQHEKSCASSRFAIGIGQQVAGDLLFDEAIERFIGIEGADHIIAISPCVSIGDVLIETIGVGIPCHIEPMPAESNSVLRRTHATIDRPLMRPRCSVLFKKLPFFDGRRDSGQIQP